MAAFVLSGVGTALLVRDLTGRPGAALVAGALFAFSPFRFDHYSHFQLQHTEWMPLALWAFHRFLRDHRRRYAVALGLAVGGQALTSMYNALFLGAYLAVVGGVVLLAEWRQLPQRLGGLLAAVVLAGALASPVAIAHLRAHDVVGGRSRAEVTTGSAVWTDFLAASPSNKLYGTLSPGLGGPERHLFLGVLGVALTIVALWPPWSPVRLAYGAGLLLSVDMARGLNGWTYGVLYEHFFVFQGLRVPSRMTIMIGLSLAVLAGYGVARVLAGVQVARGARGGHRGPDRGRHDRELVGALRPRPDSPRVPPDLRGLAGRQGGATPHQRDPPAEGSRTRRDRRVPHQSGRPHVHVLLDFSLADADQWV